MNENDKKQGPMKRIKGIFEKKQKNRKKRRYTEISRKLAIIAFSAFSLFALTVCTLLGYSYSGDSIKIISQMSEAERSSAKAYTIVYSTSDSFGQSAAVSLKDQFLAKTGSSLKIVTDDEPVGRHEIRIGYTRRMTDDYITSASALGKDGYAIIIAAGNNINIVAFSEKGADAAIKYFVNSYVGSYIGGELTLTSKMNLSVVSKNGEEPQYYLRDSKVTLNFNNLGRFKIFVVSDADINPYTVSAIENICRIEAPQLVVFAGDVSAGFSTKAELEDYVSVLTEPLESSKTPWAVIFGEQDGSGGLSAEEQMEVYSAFKYCVSSNQMLSSDSISYFLPVFEEGKGGDDGSAPVFGVWAMGQVPKASNLSSGVYFDPFISSSREAGEDYGYVSPEHLNWFAKNTDALIRAGGGYLPTIMITHTPTYEFSLAAKTKILQGKLGEAVSYSPINTGLFAAAAEAGNVLGIYSGHDHMNSFAFNYGGIELGCVASIGYDGYGFGGPFAINNSLRGGRIIELTIRDGKIIHSSRMAYASTYGTNAD